MSDERIRLHRVAMVADAIIASGARSVGLLPASEGERTEWCARDIGLALGRAQRKQVALLFSDPAEVGTPESLGERVVGRWLDERVAVVAPPILPPPGEAHAALVPLFEYAAPRCPYVVLDVSAVASREEQWGVLRLVDATCIIAFAGRTEEKELLSLERGMRHGKSLGVLLVQAK